MSEGFALTSCSSGFVPESTLSHTPEAQYGLVPRLSHQRGKNNGSGEPEKLKCSTLRRDCTICFSVEHSGAVYLLFSGCKPIGVDVVAGGFYLGACTQGKAYRHNIKDEVLT